MSRQQYILKIASQHGTHEARGWFANPAMVFIRVALYAAAVATGGELADAVLLYGQGLAW
ncbi:hypothetical protein [Ruegeria atlantica]|uniref:hypothetical protein n=1 Tax=Ruegeria atlantica TaxID=81569 RepID=UPI0014799914|nr:hypothetical protein [Ruegeria atlantica]